MNNIKAAFAGVFAWLNDDRLFTGAFAFGLGFALTWALL